MTTDSKLNLKGNEDMKEMKHREKVAQFGNWKL